MTRTANTNYTATNTDYLIPGADSDIIDRDDLAKLGTAVDEHTHASSRGLQIPTGGITDLAVTAAKIANTTVTAAKIAAGTITNTEINASAAIAQSKLATIDAPTVDTWHVTAGSNTASIGIDAAVEVTITLAANPGTTTYEYIVLTPLYNGTNNLMAHVKSRSGASVVCSLHQIGGGTITVTLNAVCVYK